MQRKMTQAFPLPEGIQETSCHEQHRDTARGTAALPVLPPPRDSQEFCSSPCPDVLLESCIPWHVCAGNPAAPLTPGFTETPRQDVKSPQQDVKSPHTGPGFRHPKQTPVWLTAP